MNQLEKAEAGGGLDMGWWFESAAVLLNHSITDRSREKLYGRLRNCLDANSNCDYFKKRAAARGTTCLDIVYEYVEFINQLTHGGLYTWFNQRCHEPAIDLLVDRRLIVLEDFAKWRKLVGCANDALTNTSPESPDEKFHSNFVEALFTVVRFSEKNDGTIYKWTNMAVYHCVFMHIIASPQSYSDKVFECLFDDGILSILLTGLDRSTAEKDDYLNRATSFPDNQPFAHSLLERVTKSIDKNKPRNDNWTRIANGAVSSKAHEQWKNLKERCRRRPMRYVLVDRDGF